jgi:Family of unknown function (DUF6314)
VSTTDDLLAWLDGDWSITRAINGRADAFVGTARFVREDDARLRWEERGHLVLDAYSGPASRTLRILRAGDTYNVLFSDGRFFHTLDLGTGGHCDALHPCGEDLYRGTYAIESDDVLRVVWHVDGPRKRDVIESVYRRA